MRTMITWWKKKGAFVPFVGLCLILLGIQAAVCTTLDSKMPYGEMACIYSVVSLLLVFYAFLPERWFWTITILLLAALGVFVWRNWWNILDHAQVLAYYINQKYQAYMSQDLFPQEWCSWGELRHNVVLIGFYILVGMYIAWSSLKLHSKLLMSMPVILVYCGALLLGVTPGQLPTLLLIIGMALEMQWITEQQKIRSSLVMRERTEQIGSGKRISIVVFILVAGLSISWHLSSKISGRVFRDVNRIQIRQHQMEQDLKIMVQTRGQQLRGMLGIDSDGYLSNVAPKYLNKTVFTVTVSEKPKNAIYLRGFIGDIYQGGKWKASKNIQKESGKRKRGVWKGKYCQSQYTTFDPKEMDITIQYTRLGKRSKYLYTPYSKSDAMNKMSREEQSLCVGEEDDFLSLYQSLAEELIEDEYYSIDSNLIMDVQNVLWRNASYSLELDPIPRNQDYAEYFLFYSQKGYCEHFATAGTLLLRNMYHAARYVSGYRIPSSRFTYNKEDGTYTAEVLDSDAHAWSEVWVNRDCWMPQEMTPSSEGSESFQVATDPGDFEDSVDLFTPTESPSLQQTSEPSETEPAEEETEAPSLDPESEDSQGNLTEDGDVGFGSGDQMGWNVGRWWKGLSKRQQILLAACGIIVCILICSYLFYQGRKRRKQQRMAQMRERNRPAYIRMRLEVFLNRLHRSRVAVKATMPEQQWLQVLSEELQEQTDPEEMETVAELIRRAAYSREMVTEAEVDWFDAYCDRVESSLAGRFPIFRNKRLKGKWK